MSETDVVVENLAIARGSKEIIKDVSFTVRKGQILAIVGESGGGKTTLAKALCGLIDETEGFRCSGRAIVAGLDIVTATRAQLYHFRGKAVGLIVQALSDALNPHLTVLEHVREMQAQHRIKEPGAAAMCERYNLPSHLHHRYPFQLSGGEIQRLLTILALMNNPTCLVLDEPTASLDEANKERAIQSFLSGHEDRVQILITHDLGLAHRMADRIGILQAGSLIELGATCDIFDGPKKAYTKTLLQNSRTVCKISSNSTSKGEAVEPNINQESGLSISNLSYAYDGKKIFSNVSAFVPAGQCLAILGASGCGKSTMARLIANYVPIQGGQLGWSDCKTASLSPSCCLVSQHPQRALARHFSVIEVLREALEFAKAHPGELGLLHRFKGLQQKQSDSVRNKIMQLLHQVGLPFDEDFLRQKTAKLSGGEAQRLVIARALAAKPNVIVADEPTSALDQVSSKQVMQLLNQVMKNHGVSLVLFTHDLSVAHQLADQCRQMTKDGLSPISLQVH